MLETHELRLQLKETRQQLVDALYENDAAKRVVARLLKERDQLRQHVETSAPIEMQVDTKDYLKIIAETAEVQRKAPPTLATQEELQQLSVLKTVTHLHTQKEPQSNFLALGSHLLSGGKDGSCFVITLEGEAVGSTKAHKKPVTSVQWLADDQFVSSSVDGTVKHFLIEETKSGHKIKAQTTYDFEPVRSVSVHPSKKLLGVVEAHQWTLMDLETRLMNIESPGLTFGQFHPDGLLFATGNDKGQILVWDIKKKELAATLEEHQSPVTQLNFNENGYLLVSTSKDQVVCWDLRKLQAVHKMDVESPVAVFDHSGKLFMVKKWISVHKLETATPITSLSIGQDCRSLFLGEQGRKLEILSIQ
ncbi:WD40-repeat-containing domain protein [Gorgonomyces haynaldii]|nr:WD40-repeat-containing domain protein [Gorgonomyces haynaldii]